jgi:hypothetical protein
MIGNELPEMLSSLAYFGIFAWWYVGFYSCIYWWTKDLDLCRDDLAVFLITGFAGPIMFVFGWLITAGNESKIIIRKRKS